MFSVPRNPVFLSAKGVAVYDNGVMGIEMIFIFLLALILFGPKKLPEIAREVGKFVAEFKRASNDFKYQLQTEIEKAGAESTPTNGTGAQQTTSFTQTLLPPAVKNALSGIDSAHDRLMKTARMAFDTQSYTPHPAEVVAEPSGTEAPAEAEARPAEAEAPLAVPMETVAMEPSAPITQTSTREAFPESSLMMTDQPTPDPAPAKSNAVPQGN
jgi:sec-independent protein translocase protein TatB